MHAHRRQANPIFKRKFSLASTTQLYNVYIVLSISSLMMNLFEINIQVYNASEHIFYVVSEIEVHNPKMRREHILVTKVYLWTVISVRFKFYALFVILCL